MPKDKNLSEKTVRSSPALTGEHPVYKTTAGDTVRVVSVFCGEKSASELIHKAAVRKILYEGQTKALCK